MNDKDETNEGMANDNQIVFSYDTLGTPVLKVRQNLKMSSLTLREDNIECVDEKVSHYNNCEDSSEHVQSSEYVNYYDNESYVLEQLKTEFPEDVLPQSDCSLNTQIHSENKELLKFIAEAEIKDENTEDGLSLNIKEENDYNEYRFIVKTEGLEEQQDVQCKFYHNTLNNGCNLLQNGNKHVKVEITTPVDNGITELHQCKYCGNGFDNYNNMLIHISNEHKTEKSKCDICGKQFKSVGNLKRHILAFHKLDKPLEPITENCHVDFQHKCPLNDHSKLSCSSKEDGEDEGENKVTRNIMNCDYGIMFVCRCGKQFRSLIQLRDHQMHKHRPTIPNINNERFQCDSCQNFFKTKSNLFLHIQNIHYDYGRKFECWCGKQFRSPRYLRKHESRAHRRKVHNANNSKFQCDYCKKIYKNRWYLAIHIKALHFDHGKRFDCWCGKQFRSAIQLRDHKRHNHRYSVQNTNHGKFQCDYCKKNFINKPNLAKHIRALHFDYGRKFECCGKQFRSPIHLSEHERNGHSIQNANNGKFQCDYCETFFQKKSNLFVHIRSVHYDYGKQFNCWCGKQFRSPRYLREHERRTHKRKVKKIN